MQTPISQSAAASAWSSRRAYGAPDAPVMPRKTRTAAWNTTPRDADADRGNCFAASPRNSFEAYLPPLEDSRKVASFFRLSSPRPAKLGIGLPLFTQAGHLRCEIWKAMPLFFAPSALRFGAPRLWPPDPL